MPNMKSILFIAAIALATQLGLEHYRRQKA